MALVETFMDILETMSTFFNWERRSTYRRVSINPCLIALWGSSLINLSSNRLFRLLRSLKMFLSPQSSTIWARPHLKKWVTPIPNVTQKCTQMPVLLMQGQTGKASEGSRVDRRTALRIWPITRLKFTSWEIQTSKIFTARVETKQ